MEKEEEEDDDEEEMPYTTSFRFALTIFSAFFPLSAFIPLLFALTHKKTHPLLHTAPRSAQRNRVQRHCQQHDPNKQSRDFEQN